MDFWVAFWTAIFTGLAIWILKKIGKRKLSKRVGQVATILGVAPIMAIFFVGVYRMANAPDPTLVHAIGTQTAVNLGEWLTINFVSVIAGYLGGFVLVKILPR